ncbi:MAG TPA: protein phosphatase CheZ [Rhodocyclaceae bacterium]|nr:protein phosphatase CheZ [Rhodocyclaceae bacterium]
MARAVRKEETNDSADLQALFDSIAAQSPVEDTAACGDTPDLEALFESASAGAVQRQPGEPSSNDTLPIHHCETVFNRVGHMARQLHDTLRELGYDKALEEAAREIPDARQRLAYIAQMTEQAAMRSLAAVEASKPVLDQAGAKSRDLADRWDQVFDGRMGVDEFKQLAGTTREFLKELPAQSGLVGGHVLDIMMAQGFQDLTGQVIKRVVEMAGRLEQELMQVLIETIPEERRSQAPQSLLNGPVIDATGRSDVVTSQSQVDELLDSLGF